MRAAVSAALFVLWVAPCPASGACAEPLGGARVAIESAYAEHDAVVRGVAVSSRQNVASDSYLLSEHGYERVKACDYPEVEFRVVEVLKGGVAEQIDVIISNRHGSCGLGVEPGTEYLLYVRGPSRAGGYSMSEYCSRSRKVAGDASVAAELAVLRGLRDAPGSDSHKNSASVLR